MANFSQDLGNALLLPTNVKILVLALVGSGHQRQTHPSIQPSIGNNPASI